jgi:hypothetical protein
MKHSRCELEGAHPEAAAGRWREGDGDETQRELRLASTANHAAALVEVIFGGVIWS